jgi:intracellular sulfur oxidation DsrE/DsrF family protein
MAGVVFQLNEKSPEKQQMVLRNIRHTVNGLPNLMVELVVHGPGLDLVVTGHSTLAEEVRTLQAAGVRIAVCENTMRAQGITPQDLLPNMTVVPSGIVAIIQRQQEGYSYIKP